MNKVEVLSNNYHEQSGCLEPNAFCWVYLPVPEVLSNNYHEQSGANDQNATLFAW